MPIDTYDQLGNLESRNTQTTGRGGGGFNLSDPRRLDTKGVNQSSNGGDRGGYEHDTTNLAPSETATHRIEFQPNILDYYDQHTYHWKLFITTLDNAASGKILNEANQVIIAESGVSDLTIDKVEFKGEAGPSADGGTGTQTDITFEIVEPSGAGLLDKIYYQSLDLGIGNWMTMPLYIQLEFRGREPDTSNAVLSDSQNGIGALKWIWPITFSEVDAHVSEVGTRYSVKSVPYSQLAQTDLNSALPQNFVLDNLTNFGDAMRALEDKLNADQYEQLIGDACIPNTYKIIVEQKLADVKLVSSKDHKSTAFGKDWVNLDKKSASFNQGTSIDNIVNALLCNTDFFQERMPGAKTPTAEPDTSNEQLDQMKKLWRIVTDTKPIAYDVLRGTNALAMTIYIVIYDLGVLNASSAQTAQTPETLPSSKKRILEYSEKIILQKIYNYIYTGLNDQIVTFDLKLNHAAANTVSRYGGNYSDSFTLQPGVSRPENYADIEKNIKEQVKKALSFINTSKSDSASQAVINDTKKAIANAATSLDPATIARYNLLLDHGKPAQRTAFTKNITASGGFNNDGTLNAPSPAPAISASNLTALKNGRRFISDVDLTPATTAALQSTYNSTKSGKMRPQVFVQGASDTAMKVGMDPSSDAGRARSSSLFATALYSGQGASLQTLEMTIKGDPFWLYPRQLGASDIDTFPYLSNLEPEVAIKEIKDSHKNSTAIMASGIKKNISSVNVLGTDNFIVVRFRTPRIFNETTGVTDPFTEVETFSGVYKITEITSKFEMGKFQQTLKGVIDPNIDLSEMPEILNQKINTAATDKSPSLTKATNLIPTSGTKTPSKLGVTAPDAPGFDTSDAISRRVLSSGPGSGSSTRNT